MRFHSPSHDDDENEEENFFDEEDMMDDGELFYQEDRQLKIAELNLVGMNLNRRILVGAVKMLEKSFWWKFLPHKTRLGMIRESYRTFSKLLLEE